MGETVFPGTKSFGAARISDHANLLDGEVIVIGDQTYEFNSVEGDIEEGNIWVDPGADEEEAIANFVDAVTENPPSPQIDAYVDPIDAKVARLEAHDVGTPGNIAFTTTFSDGGNIIAASSDLLTGGERAKLTHVASGRHTVTVLDVLAGSVMIPTKLTAPKILSIQVFSSVGVLKAVTTKWGTSTTRIKGDYDGGTNPAQDDVVAWTARD